MQKTFFTVFSTATNTHLTKDVGQIPYQMSRLYGYSAYLITEANSSFENATSDTPTLTVEDLGRKRFFIPHVSTFLYVAGKAKGIDILNLYHLTVKTRLLSIIYKLINPRGFCYIKLDVNVQYEKEIAKTNVKRGQLRSLLIGALNKAFFASVDLFSAESKEAVKLISERYPLMTDKILEVTNGMEVASCIEKTIPDGYRKKRNLIITVGRLGTHQKNNELLLQALENVNLKHWEVAFIGPSTEEFKILFNELIERRPEFENKVRLIGNITNRKELMEWYKSAKLFVLTSRFEGFPLVFSEAQSCGDYLVSTDVSSIDEITNFGEFGEIVSSDDALSLTSCLQNLIDSQKYDQDFYKRLINYAHGKYDWSHILPALQQRLSVSGRCDA